HRRRAECADRRPGPEALHPTSVLDGLGPSFAGDRHHATSCPQRVIDICAESLDPAAAPTGRHWGQNGAAPISDHAGWAWYAALISAPGRRRTVSEYIWRRCRETTKKGPRSSRPSPGSSSTAATGPIGWRRTRRRGSATRGSSRSPAATIPAATA